MLREVESLTATISPKLRENHAFDFPVYALHNILQTGGRMPKCNPRASMGLYLRPSTIHSFSVSLILNMETVIVSPKFQVQKNDFFETVRPTAVNPPTLS